MKFGPLALAFVCLGCNTFATLEPVEPVEGLDATVDIGVDAADLGVVPDVSLDAEPDLPSTPALYAWESCGRTIEAFAEISRFDDGGRSVDKISRRTQHLIFAENHVQFAYFRQAYVTALSFERSPTGEYALSASFPFRGPPELEALQLMDFSTRVVDGDVFRSFAGHDCDVNQGDLEIFAWASQAADTTPTGLVDPMTTCENVQRYGFATDFLGGLNPVTGLTTYPIHYMWLYQSLVDIRPEGFNPDLSRLILGEFGGDFRTHHPISGNHGRVAFSLYSLRGRIDYADRSSADSFRELGLTTNSDRVPNIFVDGDQGADTYVLAYLDGANRVNLAQVTCADGTCTHAPAVDETGNPVDVGQSNLTLRVVPVRGGFVLFGHRDATLWWNVYAFSQGLRLREIPRLHGEIEAEGTVVESSAMVVPTGECGADLLIGHRIAGAAEDKVHVRGFRTNVFFGND